MDERTPLTKDSSQKNTSDSIEKKPVVENNGNRIASIFSPSFYFSTTGIPRTSHDNIDPQSKDGHNVAQSPIAGTDDDEEEENVAFLSSDDAAEDTDEEHEDDLDVSEHHVTFAFEDDDDDEGISYDDDSEDADDDDLEEEDGHSHSLKEKEKIEVKKEQDVRHRRLSGDERAVDSILHVDSYQKVDDRDQEREQFQNKRRKHKKRRKLRQNKHEPSQPSQLTSTSTPPPSLTRRNRSQSFDTQNTGYTQNTVFSEAIATVISHAKDIIVEGITEVSHVVSEVMHEEIKPVIPRAEGLHRQKLSAIALAVLVFYKVSGGPFGCEPAVRSAGNFWALVGFVFFPFVWALQEALVTAELGSAFPEPSGSVAWVEEAFGTKAGLICGYFHWVAGATDNALYPTLFLEYVVSYLVNLENRALVSGDGRPWFSDFANVLVNDNTIRFLLCVLITILLSMLNFLGLEIVGNVSIIVCILSMSPFFLLFILGLPKVDTSRWFVMPDTQTSIDDDGSFHPGWLVLPNFAGVIWRPFINSLYWNLNSFDVGASFAGEVKNPERVFPRAMFLSFVFVVFSYTFTLFVALGATDDSQDEWKAGHLSVVASEVVGPWLGAWTVFAAAIGNIALYEAEMSGDAFQLMGMGDRGLVPKIFSKRSKFGTPTYGIILGTVVIIFLSMASFDAIVEMLNFAYSLSLLMEYAAFVKLRITDDDVHRPYRIPLGLWGCIAFVLPSCLICILVIMIASKATYVYFMLLCAVGIIFHALQKIAKHYSWWEYAEPPQKKRRRSLQPIMENA